MKTALLAITLLAACLGPGHTALSQEASHPHRPLTWEQLARQAGLAGYLQPKTPDEFRVESHRLNPQQVWYVAAEIDLTAAEWAQFTESKGLSNLGFFTYWCHGELESPARDLTRPHHLSQGKVDLSKIPAKNYHIGLGNEDGQEYRLYVLAPNKDGKTGSLFYFYHVSRPKSVQADPEPPAKAPFAELPAGGK